jgi:hypothetical protein
VYRGTSVDMGMIKKLKRNIIFIRKKNEFAVFRNDLLPNKSSIVRF